MLRSLRRRVIRMRNEKVSLDENEPIVGQRLECGDDGGVGHGSEHDGRRTRLSDHPTGTGHGHGIAQGRLQLAIFLTMVILVVEVIGGVLANSLALLGDAGHVLTDLFALALTWYAIRLAARPPTSQRTFGHHRVGIMVALFNAVTLIAVVVGLAWAAWHRFQHPQAVQPLIMLAAAAVGVVINLIIGFGLRDDDGDLNIRSAVVHVFGDVAAGLAVILAAIAVAATGWRAIDPILSLLLAGFIAWGACQVLGASVNILLEGVPRGLNLNELIRRVMGLTGVQDIHDLHVWSLGSKFTALSAHILVDDQKLSDSERILENVRELLAEEFGIHHTTIQMEQRQCGIDSVFCASEDYGTQS